MTTMAVTSWWHPAMPVRLVRAAIARQPGALTRLACACSSIARIRDAANPGDPDAELLRTVADRLGQLTNSRDRR